MKWEERIWLIVISVLTSLILIWLIKMSRSIDNLAEDFGSIDKQSIDRLVKNVEGLNVRMENRQQVIVQDALGEMLREEVEKVRMKRESEEKELSDAEL